MKYDELTILDNGYYDKSEVDTAIKELKRALWLARAERAQEKLAWFRLWNTSISTMNPEDGAWQEFDKWIEVERECRKKAEEYV